MYQRMNTPGDDNNNGGDEDEDADSGPDDSAFDFFNEHQTHIGGSGFTARSSAIAAASQSMEFDPITDRLRPMVPPTERNIAVVQQNIARLADTLTVQDQAELASSIQAAVFVWTSKRKNKAVNMNHSNLVGMQQQNHNSMSTSFQSPPPPSYMSGGMLPSSFDFPRRYENNEGADLLMGLDAPTSVFGSGGAGGVGNMRPAGQQKRRRQ